MENLGSKLQMTSDLDSCIDDLVEDEVVLVQETDKEFADVVGISSLTCADGSLENLIVDSIQSPTGAGINKSKISNKKSGATSLIASETLIAGVTPGTVDQAEVLNGKLPKDSSSNGNLLQDPVSKTQKGPPALLPLDNSPSSSDGGRPPRKAAVKSVEKLRVLAVREESNSKSYAGKIDSMLNNVTVFKTKDPNYDTCHGCQKMEPCYFRSNGKQGKEELQFCTRKCVQSFFKVVPVSFENLVESLPAVEKESSRVPKLLDSSMDDIIIEPDIEIQTLSDEFQMEFEESETSASNASTSSIEQIEKAAKETLCCSSCSISLYNKTDSLQWESMEFCSDKCLKMYVKVIGSHCNMCNNQVSELSLGKLCVRFGTVIRQFCTSECLEKFKSIHKLCAQCQVNMTEKLKVYCSKACEDLSRRLKNKEDFFGKRVCAVCNVVKSIHEEVFLNQRSHWLCSKPCRNAFRFVNKVTTLSCGVCSRCFDVKITPRFVTRNSDKDFLTGHVTLSWFCSNICFATHLLRKRKIEICVRCQVKKYNVDMIRKPAVDANNLNLMETKVIYFCSIYCYTHHQNPPNEAAPIRKKVADSPATISNPVASAAPPLPPPPPPPPPPPSFQTQTVPARPAPVNNGQTKIVVSKVTGAAVSAPNPTVTPTSVTNHFGSQRPTLTSTIPIEISHKVVIVPPKPNETKNKSVWCRLDRENDDNSTEKSSETNQNNRPFYIPIPIPIPVPIYVPIPMAMYNFPAPFPVGMSVPIATPVLLPVDKDLLEKMLETINQSKIKTKTVDTEQADEMDDDQLIESAPDNQIDFELDLPSYRIDLSKVVNRKRSNSTCLSTSPLPKRLKDDECRDSSDSEDIGMVSESPALNISGGFQKGLGLKAWTNWLGVHESQNKILKEMCVSEMNSSLIAFANEIRKPNGDCYRPDILVYFVYGLQQSFGVDRHRQNLLMDTALLPFQIELDKHLQPFYDTLLKNLEGGSPSELTTSLKESHLWECQQLGVDSPIVLVFTMLYFNTKYYRLYTVEQHQQMAFTHLQKVSKKFANANKNATQKTFCLQFSPTQDDLGVDNNSSNAKRPLEMPQNTERPSSCPIKHYNFYLSKCPESMKTSKDVFYLLPEASCSPESAVWYSSQPVPREILERMLRRVLLVEEVLSNLCVITTD